MRTGSCSVQQGLTPEAASVVRQAVNLARRRGHTQVTPLHVANTMLSSPQVSSVPPASALTLTPSAARPWNCASTSPSTASRRRRPTTPATICPPSPTPSWRPSRGHRPTTGADASRPSSRRCSPSRLSWSSSSSPSSTTRA
ncbi:unnamed protein product [Musa textilis]